MDGEGSDQVLNREEGGSGVVRMKRPDQSERGKTGSLASDPPTPSEEE